MFDKIKQFLLDEDKVDTIIWYTGYFIIGWLLDLCAWLASKTKTTVDDEVVAKAKEKVKEAKSKKKK